MVFGISAHAQKGGLAPHGYGPNLGDGTEKGRPQLPQLLSNSWLKPLVKGCIGRAGSSVNTPCSKRSSFIQERKSNHSALEKKTSLWLEFWATQEHIA